MVDGGPADGGLDRQLPHAQHPRGRRTERAEGSGHHDTAVLVDSERIPDHDHAAADLRLRDGHDRPQARVCDLRDRLVVHLHGARPGRRLADAVRVACTSRLRRRLGQPGGHEGDRGVVSRHRARPGRRVLQHGRLARIDAGRAAGRLGHPHARVAVRVRAHRAGRPRLGSALAGVLRAAVKASCAVAGGTRLHTSWSGIAPCGQREAGDCEAPPGAELLGHRDSAIPGRPDVGHADLLAAAVPDDAYADSI